MGPFVPRLSCILSVCSYEGSWPPGHLHTSLDSAGISVTIKYLRDYPQASLHAGAIFGGFDLYLERAREP